MLRGCAHDRLSLVKSGGQKSSCYTDGMMTNALTSLDKMSNRDLLERVREAVGRERAATARLVALLMELDTRRLYLGEGYSSLFTYCTQALSYSEHAAYNRIETARAARRFPTILGLIESGDVTLTAVRMLAPHLSEVNHRDVLERSRHKSKREIELLIATLHPCPDTPSIVRKLPTRAATTLPPPAPQTQATPDISTSVAAIAPARLALRPTEIKPLAPERYKIQFTVSRETYEQLQRAQDLLRHSVPNGDPAVIFERALRLLIADLEGTRTGKVAHPRAARAAKKDSRHIPAAVKRTVWKRDNGCCAFKGPHGRCHETGFLEYHHDYLPRGNDCQFASWFSNYHPQPGCPNDPQD